MKVRVGRTDWGSERVTIWRATTPTAGIVVWTSNHASRAARRPGA